MTRIAIVGNSGSGKTTLARRVAERLAVPHVELDSIFHQPGWTPLELDEFRARVAEQVADDEWVVDGNYAMVRDLVWSRADTIVWLDLPRRTVMRQVVRRTLRRALTREELWNGNREPVSNFLSWNPDKNIMRWAWTQHDVYAEQYQAASTDPANAHLTFVRLRRAADVKAWFATLDQAA